MSGYGAGYGRGPPQYAQQQQQQQQQYAPPQQQQYAPQDPYNQQSGSQYAPHDPNAAYYGSHEQQQQPFETVYEQDEPTSPDLNRAGAPQQQQQQQQQQYDPYQGQQAAGSQQQEASFEPPYYPGWVYDAASNSYLPDPNYQGEGQGGQADQGQADQYSTASQSHGYDAGYDKYAQQQGDQVAGADAYGGQTGYSGEGAEGGGAAAAPEAFEPPHYPGWIYDSASNSYLPDPNYQGEEAQGGESQAGDEYGAHASADQASQYGAASQDGYAPSSNEPYAADSNPYANEARGEDSYGQANAQDPYAQSNSGGDPYAQSEHDGYRNDYDGYSQEGNADPYGHSAQDAYGQAAPQDPYGQVSQDPYAQQEPEQDQYAAPPANQQQSYDPYAPASASTTSHAPSSREGPSSPTLSQNGYAPAPAQQQYTSFAAAYDAPGSQSQPAAQEYDPYAPSQRQQQAPPPQQQQAPPPAIREPGGRQRTTSDAYAASAEANDDPYAPRQARSPAMRRPTVSRPAVAISPNLPASPSMNTIEPTPESLPLAAAAPPRTDSAGAVAQPPRASPGPAAPPPRSGQAAAAPPPRSTASLAASSPRSETGPSIASPPLRAAQPPSAAAQPRQVQTAQQQQAQQQLQKPQPPRQPAGSAFDIPPLRQPTDGLGAPGSRAPRPPQAPPAAARAPSRYAQPQAEPPRRNAPADGYAPPPAPAAPRDAYAPAPQAVQPPQQRKPAAGGLQPPARRAPHQRGASAFAGDSPYGAPPQGPPTSMYEPPEAVQDIKEEEEEEEVLPQQNAEPERPEEYMPSWMQANVNAPPPQGPHFSPPTTDRQAMGGRPAAAAGPISPRIEQQPPPQKSLRAPAKLDGADDLAAGMQGMSLAGRQSPAGPPPPRSMGQGAPPPPRGNVRAPPRQAPGQAPRPDPMAYGQQGPLSPREQGASMQQQQQLGAPPQQQQYAPPQQQDMRRQTPITPDRAAVPRLNFEAPSPSEQQHAQFRPNDRQDRYAYGGSEGRRTPVPMAGIEETPEPQDTEQDDYFGGERSESAAESQYATTTDDGHMTGPTTPSSHYGGDWKADSQQHGGYDYLDQEDQHAAAPDPYAPGNQAPRDPYAPRDYPSREDSRTPSAPAPPETAYASPPSRAAPQRGAPRQPPQKQQQQRAPAPAPADAYSQYAPQGMPPRQQAGPPQQSKPYDPYAAPAPVQSAEASEAADLGLERRTAPVVSFGFGGRVLLVFPRGGQPSYDIDPSNPYGAAAKPQQTSSPTTVHLRKLDDVVPQVCEGAVFPGPIFQDGGKANSNKKRKDALSWLSQRIEELERDLAYARGAPATGFGSDHAGERKAKIEARLLLVKLLKVMLENEGKIVGSPQVDDAVRAIMNPDAAAAAAAAADTNALPTADQLASAVPSSRASTDSPFVTYGVSASDLDQMTAHLLRGDRREAVRYAVEHSMWAHAFIIASCVDTDCWKDVTNEFLRAELMPSSDHTAPGAEGREALRVAYGMFAGLGDESIQQLIPPPSLGLIGGGPGQSAPMSRAGSHSGAAAPMSQAAIDKWHETVGMIVANRTAGDSTALTSLGDALLANGRVDAAHVCYLLSPQTSFAGGMGMPNSRIILLGCVPFADDSAIDLESVKLTELLEFALSLVPVIKGHEPFIGLPHLQAFRLYHAAALADAGDVSRAHKYTEAVVNTLKLATKPSPFYHPRLVAQIKALTERLGSVPGQKETGSWLTRKVPRPTVNSLWSTFEGGFNKFVSGEGEARPQQLAAKAEVEQQANGAAVGAFSHFSSIAPDSTGGMLSRTQSSADLASSDFLQPSLPVRPSSATRPTSPLAAPSAPALGPGPQHHQSPGPPPVKRAAFKTHHARSSSLGAFAGYDYSPVAPPPWQNFTPPSLPRSRSNDGQDGQPASPRGPPSARRPQFAAVDERLHEDEAGFISPMAHLTPSVSPSPASGRQYSDQSQTHRRMTTAEELADLGIGNSKSKKPAFDTLEEELEAEEGGMPAPKKPESSAAPLGNESKPEPSVAKQDDKGASIKPSKSWLGGWFKREASPANGPGPVRAKLGDESGFHYDKNLGRWVNKAGKAPDEANSPVIPPPRASTASPSRAMRAEPARFSSEAPPPVPPMPTRSQTGPMPPLSRSATMADLRSDGRPPSAAGGPPRPPSAGAGGLPPRMTGTPTEGLSRPSSGRGKKPKYVVVPP